MKLLTVSILILSACLQHVRAEADESDGKKPPIAKGNVVGYSFTAKTKRESSRVEFYRTDGKIVFDVTCKSGIDSATITRQGKTWPKSVIVHLHLRGLESFRVENSDVAVEWSVSTTGKHRSRVSLRKDGKQTPIEKDSPYFSALNIVNGNGKIPLKVDGYFEVPLPTELFEGNPESITLHWVDFYR